MPGLFDNPVGGFLNAGAGILGGMAAASSPAAGELALRQQQMQLQQRNLQAGYEAYRQIPGVSDSLARALALDPQTAAQLIPKFQQTGQTIWGQPQYGFVNPLTRNIQSIPNPENPGEPQPGAGQQSVPSAIPGGTGGELHGEDYLRASVPKSLQDLVRNVAAYKQDPTKLAYSKGVKDFVQAAAARFDPSYDQNAYDARRKAVDEFVAGGVNSPAGMITRGNTAIAHANALLDLSPQIGGTDRAGIANSAVNFGNELLQGAKQNPVLGQYNALLGKFAEEMTSFYRGTGGAEADIDRDIKNLGPDKSPDTRAQSIARLIDGANDKVGQLQHRWQTAMGDTAWKSAIGTPSSGFSIYSPETQTHVARAQSILRGGQQQQAAQTAINRKTGQRLMLQNGQWVPMK